MRFEGKVGLVMGGTRGIGRGIARCLARDGATSILAGRDTSVGEAVAADIRAMGLIAAFAIIGQAPADGMATRSSARRRSSLHAPVVTRGRMVTTEEVGALVAYLCSDPAAAITVQAINIDGNSHQA